MLCLVFLVFVAQAQEPVPRNVRISGQKFILASSNASIVMSGPNVVVKGPPYMPAVEGNTICNDITDLACMAAGNCTTCTTFNQADVDHIKKMGWNSIRLGVVWAGAQPRDEDALDPLFLRRLHAVLTLTDANGIHVVLDNHGDMVGSAGCGNGVPTWFQLKAPGVKQFLGKPLKTGFPYSLDKSLNVANAFGYGHCGDDAEMWAAHAGDPNYNLLNECCQAMNSRGNQPALGFTEIQQRTMDFLIHEGAGRADFIRFWRLVAEAVKGHPSAFAAELMNEPITFHRKYMFETWVECAKAINAIVPDMSVSMADLAEGSLLPSWVTEFTGGHEDISTETFEWIKASGTVFYTWHYGTAPKSVNNMLAISKAWNVPTFATETSCVMFDAAAAAGISHSYWHYSCYCNTGPAFGNRSVPDDTFGACILGWANGGSSSCVRPTVVMV